MLRLIRTLMNVSVTNLEIGLITAIPCGVLSDKYVSKQKTR